MRRSRPVLVLAAVAVSGCAPLAPAPANDAAEGAGDRAAAAGEGEGEAPAAGEGEGEGDSGAPAQAGEGEGEGDGAGGQGAADGASHIPFVFVIAMENKADDGLYGNALAPYLNDVLRVEYGSANAYADCITGVVPSEPHYVWLEAGTNTFDDHTFLLDSNPSATNSTSDTRHIAAQLAAANDGRTWRSYQEGLNDSTGACPIHGSGFYAPKHDPFVFFQDVAGSPPSETNAFCADHHRAYRTETFAADLAAGDVDAYTFITPDLCHDMHGKSSCTNGCTSSTASGCISAGDSWLHDNVPPIIDFINQHGGVLFIVWDETEGSAAQPFLVIGPGVKPGHASAVQYTHSSYVKSVQAVLGLAVDPRVADANDFADFFAPGQFP